MHAMDNTHLYRNIKIKTRTQCVICAKKLSDPVIVLPKFPITEIFVQDRPMQKLGFVDQEFYFCSRCGHGQLKYLIDPNILYGNTYKTRTSSSLSAVPAIDVFLAFMADVLKNRPLKTVFEIGCNDLYTLKKLKPKADKLFGIDPILKGQEKEFSDDKISVIGDFFENVDLNRLNVQLDTVFSSHTLEHIEDPTALIQKLIDKSTTETLLFFQFPGFEGLVQDAHFDQIFHQHLNYFSLKSVLYLLDVVGAELVDFRINPYHWGALMIAFRKKRRGPNRNLLFRKHTQDLSRTEILKQYQLFKDSMKITTARIDAFASETMYGYGAALMLPVLEYYLKRITRLKAILDEDPAKTNLYYLNVPVQIKRPDQIKNIENTVMVVTAINSLQAVRSIVTKLRSLQVKKIIIPVNLI